MITFFGKLGELESKATKGPIRYDGPVDLKAFLKFPSVGDKLWEVGPDDGVSHLTQDGLAAIRHEADASLFVLLRNAAPHILSLIKACESIPFPPDEEGSSIYVPKERILAICDALTDLNLVANPDSPYDDDVMSDMDPPSDLDLPMEARDG